MVIRTALGLTLRRDREIGRSVLGTSLPAREAEGARLEQSMTGTVRAEKGEPPGDELCTQPLWGSGDEFPKLQSPPWKQLLYQVFCLALSVEKMSIWVNRIFWLSSEHKNELIWWQNCVDCQVVFPIHKEHAGKIPITCSVCQEEANIATWTVDAVHKLKALDIFYNTSQWYESSTVQ